jgi:hypothetical protein
MLTLTMTNDTPSGPTSIGNIFLALTMTRSQGNLLNLITGHTSLPSPRTLGTVKCKEAPDPVTLPQDKDT